MKIIKSLKIEEIYSKELLEKLPPKMDTSHFS